MRHYVLTRSIYDPDAWSLDANKRRLELTRAITAPSMAAQSERRWRWIVAVHPDDPLLEERKAAFRPAGCKASFLAYRGEGDPARTAAFAYRKAGWRRHMKAPESRLTTRLDDDDAFAPDAIARIQAAAEHPIYMRCRSVLMFPDGYRVHAGHYDAVRHERNAWATLQTPPGDETVIYDYSHKRIGEEMDVRLIRGGPGWARSIYDPAAWLWVRHPDTLSDHRQAEHPIDDELRDAFPAVDWALLEGMGAEVG